MSEVMSELGRQTIAVKELIDALKQYDDDELIADSIEGQTTFGECVDAVLVAMDDDEVIVAGIKDRIGVLSERQARIERRIKARRAALEAAFLIADLPKYESALATVSQKAMPAKMIITDESLIPAAYWKTGDPKLDKKALMAALKDSEHVPGATLDNGGRTIQIRVK